MARKSLGVAAAGAKDIPTFDQLPMMSYVPPSGAWAIPRHIQSVGNAGAVTSDQLCCLPFDVGPAGFTVDRLGAAVSQAQVAGTTTTSLAVYPDLNSISVPDCSAGALASGTIVNTSTGVKTVTVSLTLNANTRYWLCFLYHQTGTAPTTLPQFTTVTNSNSLWVTNANFLAAGTVMCSRYVALGSQTALPSSQPANSSWGSNLNSACPVIGLRAA